MIPSNFPQSNIKFLKPHTMTDEQCAPLHVQDTGEQFISCWKVSWKERIRILFGKPVWVWIWSRTHPPVAVDTNNPF